MVPKASDVLNLRAVQVIGRLVEIAPKATTPDSTVAAALKAYSALLEESVDVAVAAGRAYDRNANHYGMELDSWRLRMRDQPELDEQLGRLLDEQAQRLASGDSRVVSVQEMEQFLDACEEALRELADWPVRAAQESNTALARMARSERGNSRRRTGRSPRNPA
jgi:hypothetical protein